MIEDQRNAEVIGAALEAEIHLFCSEDLGKLLAKLGDELKYFFIVSKAVLQPAEAAKQEKDVVTTAMPDLSVLVKPLDGTKCVRCWHRFAADEIGQDAAHPELCNRCVSNLTAPGETRLHG